MKIKKIVLYIICYSILPIFILVDIVKIPLILFFTPLWAFLSLIDWLKGEEFFLFEFLKDSFTIGFQMWKDLIGKSAY